MKSLTAEFPYENDDDQLTEILGLVESDGVMEMNGVLKQEDIPIVYDDFLDEEDDDDFWNTPL